MALCLLSRISSKEFTRPGVEDDEAVAFLEELPFSLDDLHSVVLIQVLQISRYIVSRTTRDGLTLEVPQEVRADLSVALFQGELLITQRIGRTDCSSVMVCRQEPSAVLECKLTIVQFETHRKWIVSYKRRIEFVGTALNCGIL